MANEEDKLVWVKLVIDGHDQSLAVFEIYKPFPENVGRLTNVIMVEAKRLFEKDIHSLDVYRPGTTNALDHPGNENLLRPGLRLADLDFREITDETPLIVTAKSRQQQQPTTAVRTVYTKQAMEYSVLRLFAFRNNPFLTINVLYVGYACRSNSLCFPRKRMLV
jgi:hypothetical protein